MPSTLNPIPETQASKAIKALREQYPEGDDQIAVSPKRAAKMLDIGHSTVYKLFYEEEIQSFKIGSSRRIPVEELERYVRRQMEG